MVERVTFVVFLAILAPKPHSVSAQGPPLAPPEAQTPSEISSQLERDPDSPLDGVGGSDPALGVQPPRRVRETQAECQVPRAHTPRNDIVITVAVIHVTRGQRYSLIVPIKPYTVANCATGV